MCFRSRRCNFEIWNLKGRAAPWRLLFLFFTALLVGPAVPNMSGTAGPTQAEDSRWLPLRRRKFADEFSELRCGGAFGSSDVIARCGHAGAQGFFQRKT